MLKYFPLLKIAGQYRRTWTNFIAGTGITFTVSGDDVTISSTGGGGGGSGTVTSVSVTTANGVSGSVATATTTPAITLSLGAITPSSVAATGNVSAGGNLSATGTVSGTNITAGGNITGNAATVTTNANLTGHITSTGNATTLGSFTAAQLNAAISDGDAYLSGSTDVALLDGGTGSSLSAPSVDSGLFYDFSGSGVTWFTFGSGLTMTGTVLSATGSASSLTFSEVTGTTQAMSVNSWYLVNNASLVTLTLPDTAALGSVIKITGKGAGGWKIAQNASENINFGNSTTTTGTGGYLQSTLQYDTIELVCTVANTTWTVSVPPQGNVTIV
jgi:hypothetical protein